MSNTRSRLRSELTNLNETKSILGEIRVHLAVQDNRAVFQIGSDQFNSHDCTHVLVDESLAHDNIQFQRPGGAAVEKYDIADLYLIRRLRTKKHLILLKAGSDPAAG